MQILSLLSALAEVEKEMADLYASLAELYDGDGEAAGLFFRLSMQEHAHYNLIRFGKRLVHSSPNEFDRVAADEEAIAALVASIRCFRAAGAPSLEEAVRFSVEVERHAGESVHRRVLVDSNPKLAEMVASLAASDAEHLRALEGFAQDRFADPGEP